MNIARKNLMPEILEFENKKLNIVLTARERKKELMVRFCIAYSNILKCHNLLTTAGTARAIKMSNLDSTVLLNGVLGGYHQISSKISCNEIDIVFFFRDVRPNSCSDQSEPELLRTCDFYSIPLATNIATAEILIRRIADGNLEYEGIGKQHAIQEKVL